MSARKYGGSSIKPHIACQLRAGSAASVLAAAVVGCVR